MGILGSIGGIILRTALGMLYALLTEEFLKKLAIELLDVISKRTNSQFVKDMISAAEAEWKKPLPTSPESASPDQK